MTETKQLLGEAYEVLQGFVKKVKALYVDKGFPPSKFYIHLNGHWLGDDRDAWSFEFPEKIVFTMVTHMSCSCCSDEEDTIAYPLEDLLRDDFVAITREKERIAEEAAELQRQEAAEEQRRIQEAAQKEAELKQLAMLREKYGV
jgi:hypothetical protein